jgi:hypothetical protein
MEFAEVMRLRLLQMESHLDPRAPLRSLRLLRNDSSVSHFAELPRVDSSFDRLLVSSNPNPHSLDNARN